MRKILLILFVLFNQFVQSQNLSDNFKIGDYIEVFNTDSILVYFNCSGAIVDKDCAQFMRIGKIDSTNINVTGNFYDYYIEGNLLLKAKMENDYLNDSAIYYYKNGNIKSIGKYQDNVKKGIWKYYYENGQLEKVLNFVADYPFISEYYNEKGEQLVINGNGKYTGKCYFGNECSPLTIKGKVANGKMNGKWKLISPMSIGYNESTNSYYSSKSKQKVGYEIFENGKFIKGISGNYSYTKNQKIKINSYCVNENLFFYENIDNCYGNKNHGILTYKGEFLNQIFYLELTELLSNIPKSNLKDQWLIISIKINKKSIAEKINIRSSINDNYIENKVYDLLSTMNDWKTMYVANEPVDTDLFFSVLVRNNQVIIPKEYLYRNK